MRDGNTLRGLEEFSRRAYMGELFGGYFDGNNTFACGQYS